MRALAWIAVLSLPMAGGAQTPFNASSETAKPDLPQVGGRTAFDLIQIEGPITSIPLKNAGVIPGSEYVQLEGATLKRGQDYAIDNAAGVIYMMRQVRAGQSLRVEYRHDPERAASGSKQFASPSGFTFRVAQGTEFTLGLGLAERRQDGSVISTNVYGIKNSFSNSSGSLKGIYLLGERKKVHSESLYDPNKEQSDPEEGRSRAILQNLDTKFMGGTVQAGYQNIEDKFAGFQSFRDAGYDDATVNQLQKERGIKRFGFSMANIGLKELNFSHSYRSVRDSKDKIEWRSLAMNAGPIQMQWEGQRVGAEFSRFSDLAEADRERLIKERGLNRESLSAKLNLKQGTAEFTNLKVENKDGGGIFRRNLGLNIAGAKLSYFDQNVEPGFTQFSGLREGDANQLSREQGMRRQAFGIASKPLSFSSSSIRTDSGRFNAIDLGFQLGSWTFEHSLRQADKGFASFGSMADGEAAAHLNAIAKMYEPGDAKMNPDQKKWLLQNAGLQRSGTRISGSVLGLKVIADQVHLQSENGAGTISRFGVDSKNLKLNYREQRLGDSFSELGVLTDFERAKLGSLAGLFRQDWSFEANLTKNRSIGFSTMRADAVEGNAFRQAFSLKDKGLELTWMRRSVGKEFAEVGKLVDPEKDIFASLRGFGQSELKLKWQLLPGLGVDVYRSDSNSIEGFGKHFQTAVLNWNLDKRSKFVIDTLKEQNGDATAEQLNRDFQHVGVERDLGKIGQLHLSQETKKYGGTDGTQPDSVKQSVVYQTNLNEKTALRTEQTQTRYDNGERESISANTVSTEINKRAGISISDIRILRDGDKPDEQRRNYGFWWDFGGGLRLNYGYARNLNSSSNGELKSQFGITPGTVGGIKIDSANYQINRWDTTRNQALGNVQLGTAKPLQLGLLKDFAFFFGTNTNRDRGAWVQENQNFGFSGKLGSNSFSYQYLGQIAKSQERGVDRIFSFTTDQSEKRAFRANVKYKLRTLPEGKKMMIRDFSLFWKPTNGLEFTHQLLTNPEQARGDVLLGSITQPTRVNRWKVDFTGSASTKFGASWEETINEQNNTRSRVGGINLTLFANNPSPLLLYYGVEQLDNGGKRQTAHRYSLRFDQRPGPNQLLSLFVGNLSWQHSRPELQKIQNWTARVEFQIKF